MNKRINPDHLKVGDILLCRDSNSPSQVNVDGEIYGNWEDVTLYMGNREVLLGYIPHLHPLVSWLSAYDVWGIFRATPALTEYEQQRIIEVILDLAGLKLTWWDRIKNKIKQSLGIRVPPKFGTGLNSPEELIASGYEAAGRNISSVVPWKTELHHIDGSAILVRII